MSKFTDHLWSDLVREHGPTLAQSARPEPGRAAGMGGLGFLRRPRVLAGSTLGLAGVATALVLALGGTAATTPAFAITTTNDGVLVHLNYVKDQNLPQVQQKLASMGIHESVGIEMGTGAATVAGPLTCTPGPGVTGPKVKVLVGANGTETIGPGQSGGNTAEGSFHLIRCSTSNNTGAGNSGNG